MRLIEFPTVATLKQWTVKYDRATNCLRQQVFTLLKSSAYNGALQLRMKVEGRTAAEKAAVDTIIRELQEKGYKVGYSRSTDPGRVFDTLEISWT